MKKKIVNALIVIVMIAGLLLTAHLVVNYFDLSAIMRSVHGG
jgi:hypothetical protein